MFIGAFSRSLYDEKLLMGFSSIRVIFACSVFRMLKVVYRNFPEWYQTEGRVRVKTVPFPSTD